MSDVLGDWNGDCYIDFGDFSIIAAGWNVPGGKDINDLAVFVQYWLDCANPYDPPCCNFGEALPDFPAHGTVVPGVKIEYPPNSWNWYIWTKLSFIPGPTAVEHTGYFNEDYTKVESRAEDANLGSPPFAYVSGWEYVFFAGNPQVPPADETLVRGQKYYWTVDETDAQGSMFAGDIWEFTVLGFYAFEPSPPNEAAFVETDVFLSWQPGFGVVEHDIFMGTSWEDVNNVVCDRFNPPPEFVATVEEPNILVTGLLDNTTYYWRVDQADCHYWDPFFCVRTIYKGDVWCFTTAPSALNNDGSINLKNYPIPSNNRQKTGPIPPGYVRKDDVLDYKD
ncbi:MAG: hypothetical protein GWN76_13075 [candidate division Zixibacteria bacterium]|nr:hypothetical protein [candidate division Zixibacteria bacterium]NIW42748.1 hypothetical protein [candidate division Zixibacteria bacterium]